jgi:hypothetical protein
VKGRVVVTVVLLVGLLAAGSVITAWVEGRAMAVTLDVLLCLFGGVALFVAWWPVWEERAGA